MNKEYGCGNGIIFSWGDAIDENDKNSGCSPVFYEGNKVKWEFSIWEIWGAREDKGEQILMKWGIWFNFGEIERKRTK
jgi:hypothetical protein